jgi:hypothetical protein
MGCVADNSREPSLVVLVMIKSKVAESSGLRDGVWFWLPVLELRIRVWEDDVKLKAFCCGVLSIFEASGN